MNVKNLFLGVAIFILTIAVGIYGVRTFIGPEPDYEDSCPNKQIFTETQCTNEGGIWTNYSNMQNYPPEKVPYGAPYGDCDIYTRCQKEWERIQEAYSKKVFLSALPLAIILIIIGALVFGLESVGAGIIAGAVGIMIYGVTGFWQFAEDWIKFLISLISLAIVIFLTYYINQKFSYFTKKTKRK